MSTIGKFNAQAHYELLERRVSGIETGMRESFRDVSAKIEEIRAAVMEHRAARPISFKDGLGVVTQIGIIVAMVVSGIVYVAGNHNAVQMAELRSSVERIDRAMEWAPKITLANP